MNDTLIAPAPMPCVRCGGRIVWRYVPVPSDPGDVDSEGTCERCGEVY